MIRRVSFFVSILIVMGLTTLSALAQGDASVPVSPEAIEGITALVTTLATKAGYGGIAVLVVSILGLVGVLARAACQWLVDGGKPVPKWLSWLPVLSSVGTVNPVVGKGSLLPTTSSGSSILEKLKKLLIVALIGAFTAVVPGGVFAQESDVATPEAAITSGSPCEADLATCRSALAETQQQLASAQADPLFGILNHFGWWKKLPPKARLAIGVGVDMAIIGVSTWMALEAQE